MQLHSICSISTESNVEVHLRIIQTVCSSHTSSNRTRGQTPGGMQDAADKAAHKAEHEAAHEVECETARKAKHTAEHEQACKVGLIWLIFHSKGTIIKSQKTDTSLSRFRPYLSPQIFS